MVIFSLTLKTSQEGERAIFLRFPELRTAFRQTLKEALVGVIHATAYILADLRMKVSPQGKTSGLAKFQNVGIHPVQADVFARQAIAAPLKGNEVIPHGRGDKEFVPQLAIFLIAAVQSIFVCAPNFAFTCHALTAH